MFICLKFSSEKIGKFEDNIIFETSNIIWNNYYKGYKLNIQAQTIYPEFDRDLKTIFDKIKKNQYNLKGSLHKKCFVQSKNIFSFGSLLLRQNDEDNKKEEYWKKTYSTKLAFKNISPFSIEMNFEFENL